MLIKCNTVSVDMVHFYINKPTIAVAPIMGDKEGQVHSTFKRVGLLNDVPKGEE